MKVIMCAYGIVEFEGDLQRGGYNTTDSLYVLINSKQTVVKISQCLYIHSTYFHIPMKEKKQFHL